MSMFLTLAFLFAIGSVAGWVLEVFFSTFLLGGKSREKMDQSWLLHWSVSPNLWLWFVCPLSDFDAGDIFDY